MNEIKGHIIIFSLLLMCVLLLYTIYVIMVVTPRVDKFNGRRSSGNYWSNRMQANKYSIAFCAPEFYKKLKYYREELAFYRATPRDILHYKLYIAALLIGMTAIVWIIVM